MSAALIIIWENIYGYDEHYRCATALYLMSMLPNSFSIIIHCGISEPGHDREVVDSLNTIEKRFILQ